MIFGIRKWEVDLTNDPERTFPEVYWYRKVGTKEWIKGKKSNWLRGEYDLMTLDDDGNKVIDLFENWIPPKSYD